MVIEKRFYDYNGILNTPTDDEVGIISFGSEGCINRLPTESELVKILTYCKERRISAKCVFPRLGVFDIPIAERLLDVLYQSNQSVQIVINDIGCLYYCKKFMDRITIFLGRQLSRSIVDCPWYRNVLLHESEEMKMNLMQLSFNFKEKQELLLEYGVKGLEINTVLGVEESAKYLADFGFLLSIHVNDYLLTCGRNCLSKKIIGDVQQCDACLKTARLTPLKSGGI